MKITGWPIKPILNPTEYIDHCNGMGSAKCKLIRRSRDLSGVPKSLWENASYGSSNYVQFDGEERLGFRCCVICSRPLNATYAEQLNDELGFEAPTSDDISARLKALKERLASNEGRTS